MFIAEITSKGKNGKAYTSILLRESFRVGSKVKSKTLAVLTHMPVHVMEAVRRAIASPADSLDQVAAASQGGLQLRQAESFGAVWVVDQIARQLGIQQAIGGTPDAELGYWQVLARVLRPGLSLLAMARLAAECAAAAVLDWREAFTEDDLYANGSWLEGRHAVIERRLWQQRPARPGQPLFLYDVTSSYLEGEHNALGDWGYNRDGKKGKKQLVVGLLTDEWGEPCATCVYRGNTRDLKTFGAEVHRIQREFGAQHVTLVGDRGMIRSDQIAEAQAAGFHYISALTKPQIEKLLRTGVFQLELFKDQVCEVAGEAGHRYVLRRNPTRQTEMAAVRAQKKQALQAALTQANTYLAAHPRARVETQQKHLAAKLNNFHMEGWLELQVQQRQLSLKTHEAALAEESRLDGCYVVHTDLSASQASAQTVHDRYKDLAQVERDFRVLKTGHLNFRPWYVCKEENTQAHALTAMLALKVRRHLEKAWWPLEVTVEEGLDQLAQLCVLELVHPQTQAVVTRQVPRPSAHQQRLLDALKLTLPSTVPLAKVAVGTRKKINKERKTLVK